MAKKSIKKLWKEKAQGKYHIGCIFPNDTPYGNYGDKKCYLSKVKKNGEYEFTLDHTYAKDFSEQKADEMLKKLKDEFGGKIVDEALLISPNQLNESYKDRKLLWSSTQEYDYWENEATDDEVLEEFQNMRGEIDEDYAEFDDEGNIVSYYYDEMRDYICTVCQDGEVEWEDFEYNIVPNVVKQLNDDILIIDGEIISPDDRYHGREAFKKSFYYAIARKIQDYYGNAEVYLDEEGNVEDWYTLPESENMRYVLARKIPWIKDAYKDELKLRAEYEEDGEEYDGDYPGKEGKELWLALYDDLFSSIPYAADNVEFDGLEDYLTPIKNPYNV